MSVVRDYFNPRSRKESDTGLYRRTPNITRFQSTLSQGERPWVRKHRIGGTRNFNPRSRKESDAGYNVETQTVSGFQSTLSQGERQRTHLICFWHRSISIHALARRATCGSRWGTRIHQISIHALARRATFFWPNHQKSHSISIHALARRATRNQRRTRR